MVATATVPLERVTSLRDSWNRDPREGYEYSVSISRRIPRPLLASMFVSGGLDAIRNPESKVERAEAVTQTLTNQVPGLPKDTVTLIKWNGMARSLRADCLLSVSSGGRRRWCLSVQLLPPPTRGTDSGKKLMMPPGAATGPLLQESRAPRWLDSRCVRHGRCSFAGVEGPARHTSAEKCRGLGPGIFHSAHSPSNLKNS